MQRRNVLAALVCFAVVAAFGTAYGAPAGPDKATCYKCHDQIKEFHMRGKHKNVECSTCHEGLKEHLSNSAIMPVTRTGHEVCGGCHKDQYESLISFNEDAKAKVEKATFRGRSPMFDKLIMPYGFSKEHNSPRSHVFMLLDHLIVDRAYGGRFQLKSWTEIINAKGADKDVWDLLIDREPSTSEQKAFMPQVYMSANPVCLQCKSQDQILKWKYMGDKDPKAVFDRTSNVVEEARSLKHAINCFMCHDPHSAEPRVVRDAQIQAVVDRGEGTYPYDKEKSAKITMKKVVFRDFRAIGLLSQPDSTLMCGQCHVEYVCNPGFSLKTGEPIMMSDPRTNYFPWVSVLDLKKKYEALDFKDFRHTVTGALLTKLQHPETETFWGSKHERAGLTCADCHMPKLKDKSGKTYTSHAQRSPRLMLKETCLKCHSYWTPKEAEYEIDAIQGYTRGKITKAEFWLSQLIDKYEEARMAGVSEDVLKQARAYHDTAHIMWEWWTAENSDGFHNPELARESLTRSITASQDGIALLTKAMVPPAAAAPAAAH